MGAHHFLGFTDEVYANVVDNNLKTFFRGIDSSDPLGGIINPLDAVRGISVTTDGTTGASVHYGVTNLSPFAATPIGGIGFFNVGEELLLYDTCTTSECSPYSVYTVPVFGSSMHGDIH